MIGTAKTIAVTVLLDLITILWGCFTHKGSPIPIATQLSGLTPRLATGIGFSLGGQK